METPTKHSETGTDWLASVIAENEPSLPEYLSRVEAISARVPGWSRQFHYLFFKSWLNAFPNAKSVLMLGVYLGRDISFLLDATGARPMQIIGVDKFNAEPCADWPEEKRGKTWEENGFGPPPNIEVALKNIDAREPHAVKLIQADDAVWLPSARGTVDLIYIDTSHDAETVRRQIDQVRKHCHQETIIAGDDYANLEKTWGVRDAVHDRFKSHRVVADTIWFAGTEDFR